MKTKLINLFEIVYFLPDMALIFWQKFENFLQNQMLSLVQILPEFQLFKLNIDKIFILSYSAPSFNVLKLKFLSHGNTSASGRSVSQDEGL